MERVSWADVGAGRPYCLNRYRSEGSFRYPLHDHEDHWEFVYGSGGSFRHFLGGRWLDHGAGLLVLVRDADAHALKGRDFSYVNLAFHPAWLDRLDHYAGVGGLRRGLERGDGPRAVVVAEAERGALERDFDELLRASDAPNAALRFGRVLAALVLRFRDEPAPTDPVPTTRPRPYAPVDDAAPYRHPEPQGGDDGAGRKPAPQWLSELLDWATRQSVPPRPGEFCAKSGYAREHVIRSMRRYYGRAPGDFLEDLRLDRAQDLLRFTNYPVARIALEAGWDSQRQFQRSFGRRWGTSPSEYRARWARLAHPAIGQGS